MAGRISDQAVRASTGKGWAEWFEILDGIEAVQMKHRDIAQHLYDEHGVDGWWAQMVAVQYEQERGLRAKHEKPEGFEISRGKTVAAPLDVVYAAWSDGRRRRRWLSEPIEIRKATPGKSLRITWPDGTSVSVELYRKGTGKSQVSVQHGKLPDAAAAERMKEYWARTLEALKSAVEA
ncbi:MAG: hypothetical protein HY704_13865 [Gemmatimonadetes bacterium]|nr:hypothetical protein [Gemmatimonadota bacterium]